MAKQPPTPQTEPAPKRRFRVDLPTALLAIACDVNPDGKGEDLAAVVHFAYLCKSRALALTDPKIKLWDASASGATANMLSFIDSSPEMLIASQAVLRLLACAVGGPGNEMMIYDPAADWIQKTRTERLRRYMIQAEIDAGEVG